MRILLENLSKHFGKVRAVDSLNLEIKEGEFLVLLGPSGCGKTTTLLLIAGLYKPTSGNIYFGEKIVNNLSPKDRGIGMVFQSYALYPHMNVYENIAFPLTLMKKSKSDIDKMVREIVKFVQLDEELLERRPGQLSGGQQQRVALARALVKGPNILLLDEPLSNLDAKLRLIMRTEIKHLQKHLGITTILVTHDQVEAMTMGDRIALMQHGKIQQVGTPDELYNQPINLFTAGFIGSPPMNIYNSKIGKDDEGYYVLVEESFKLRFPEKIFRELKEENIFLGIRPEHVSISLQPSNNLISGIVYVTEPLGREVLLNIQVGKVLLKSIAPQNIKLSSGDKVWINFDVNYCHFFDKNGNRIKI
jgi:ABC-type sugar transport system ATPase subunit